jgi:hypothetical protein
MSKEIEQPSQSLRDKAEWFFHNNRVTMRGVSAGEYLDKEDFFAFVQSLTDLPLPASSLKWVKASERLPGEANSPIVVFRQIGTTNIHAIYNIPGINNRANYWEIPIDELEWLYESAPTTEPLPDGEYHEDTGKLVKRFGEVVKEKQEYKEECERLAGVAKFWQEKYYELNPGWQPPKIDNFGSQSTPAQDKTKNHE